MKVTVPINHLPKPARPVSCYRSPVDEIPEITDDRIKPVVKMKKRAGQTSLALFPCTAPRLKRAFD